MQSFLGKIVLFFPILLIAAQLQVHLEKNPIALGEPAKLIIKASGDDIELPKIQKIAGYPVAGHALAESVVEQNGQLIVKKRLVLTFYPDQNVTIEPIVVRIDGKEYKSDPIELKIDKKITKDKYVSFTLVVDKKEAYVGEPIIMEMVLKIRRGLHIVNYDFVPPKFDGFWVKELKSSSKYLEEHGEYLIKRIKFLLLPQKPGRLAISPALFKYATIKKTEDSFGFSISVPSWKSVVSNSIQIIAKPLPKDVDLVGDFNLSVKVDKERVKAGEPVNVTLQIEGEGNIENFNGIDLNLSWATVYSDKPTKRMEVKGGKVFSTFTQHFSIVSDRSYSIPAIDIEYFSLKEKKLKKLHHDPIHIEVEGGKAVVTKIDEPSNKKKSGTKANKGFDQRSFWIGFGAGVVSVLLGFGGYLLFRRFWNKGFHFEDKKAMLNALMPYISTHPKAASMAQALYEEIYEQKRSKVKKKDVERLLQDLMKRSGTFHPRS